MVKNKMVTALMEEYRKSTVDFKNILDEISLELFEKIMDNETTDPDCKSVQTITNHVVQSGYTYANYINVDQGGEWDEYEKLIANPKQGIIEINKMLDFTENVLNKTLDKSIKELELRKYETRWDVTYDFEQMLAHAIVHFLRHRRQIENFIL